MNLEKEKNKDNIKLAWSELQARIRKIKLGGGKTRLEKIKKQGKLNARERINYLVDDKENIFEIDEILLDDLNTPGYIAKIHELYNAASKGDDSKKLKFNQACKLIGLFNISKREWESSKKSKISVSEGYITRKIDERTKAKKNGNFVLADKIREELLSKGIIIEDQKEKTIWKVK